MSTKRIHIIAASCERPFIRAILLAVVFAAVAWAFSWNFERRMAQLNAGYIQDKGQVLSSAERRALEAVRQDVQQQVGLKLLLRVEQGQGAVQLPSNAADTVFMGCNPQTSAALIVLPPLAKKAVGEGPRLLLEEGLTQCLTADAQLQAGQTLVQPSVFVCLERSAKALIDALTDQR